MKHALFKLTVLAAMASSSALAMNKGDDEADNGNPEANLTLVQISYNKDEGLDFDEAGEGGKISINNVIVE